jgi:hypothetical protein
LKKEFWFVPPSGMLLKAAIEKVGYYSEEVLIEDYNFFVRLLLFFKVKYCDYPCIIYRERRQRSHVVKEWDKNNGERYFYERVISNVNAWKLTKRKPVKILLERKINQYMKSLAIYNSPSFFRSVWYLFKRQYFKIPLKLFLIKFSKAAGLLPKTNMEFPEYNSWI